MKSQTDINNFRITDANIQFIGSDLKRPESILATSDGTLYTADSRGGVMRINPDGTQELLIASEKPDGTAKQNNDDQPNGMTFDKDGNIIIANFGKCCVELLDVNTKERKVLIDHYDGKPLGKVNFVLRDSKNRLYVTVSTRQLNWREAIKPNINDGYILLIDNYDNLIEGEPTEIKIVADNLAFTNEARLDAEEKHLYISETYGRHITRMRVLENGALSDREIYGPEDLGSGGFPDGIAFDNAGNLWGTMVHGEKIFVITPEQKLHIVYDGGNEALRQQMDAAFFASSTDMYNLFLKGKSRIAPTLASVNFGGDDLSTIYIGSLGGDRIPYFKSPIPGLPLIWHKEMMFAISR